MIQSYRSPQIFSRRMNAMASPTVSNSGSSYIPNDGKTSRKTSSLYWDFQDFKNWQAMITQVGGQRETEAAQYGCTDGVIDSSEMFILLSDMRFASQILVDDS